MSTKLEIMRLPKLLSDGLSWVSLPWALVPRGCPSAGEWSSCPLPSRGIWVGDAIWEWLGIIELLPWPPLSLDISLSLSGCLPSIWLEADQKWAIWTADSTQGLQGHFKQSRGMWWSRGRKRFSSVIFNSDKVIRQRRKEGILDCVSLHSWDIIATACVDLQVWKWFLSSANNVVHFLSMSTAQWAWAPVTSECIAHPQWVLQHRRSRQGSGAVEPPPSLWPSVSASGLQVSNFCKWLSIFPTLCNQWILNGHHFFFPATSSKVLRVWSSRAASCQAESLALLLLKAEVYSECVYTRYKCLQLSPDAAAVQRALTVLA